MELIHNWPQPIDLEPYVKSIANAHPVIRFPIQATIELVKIVAATAFLELLSQALFKKGSYSKQWKAPIFFITVTAPFVEEFIFRGIVLRGIHVLGKGAKCVILRRELTENEVLIGQIVRIQISAILFAAVHLFNPYPRNVLIKQFVGAYVYGNLLGYLSEKYQTLSVAILAHGMNNSLVIAMEVYPKFGLLFRAALIVNQLSVITLVFQDFITLEEDVALPA